MLIESDLGGLFRMYISDMIYETKRAVFATADLGLLAAGVRVDMTMEP